MQDKPKAALMLGRRFGRLVVQSQAESDHFGKARWHCLCDCGSRVVVYGYQLRMANPKHRTQSCGCLKHERGRKARAAPRCKRQVARLHSAVWPKECRACGRAFIGTARQHYCSPECRPSHYQRVT